MIRFSSQQKDEYISVLMKKRKATLIRVLQQHDLPIAGKKRVLILRMIENAHIISFKDVFAREFDTHTSITGE